MQNDLNAYRLTLIRKFESENDKKAKSKANAYKNSIYANN